MSLRFAGEGHDQIGGQADIRDSCPELFHLAQIVFPGIVAVHEPEDLIIAALGGQMQLMENMPALGHHFDQFVAQILGMGGHEADAGNVQPIQLPQQLGEGISVFRAVAVAVHVLAQQHDFLYAGLPELLRFPEDILHAAGALPAPHIGHDAVGTEIVAAVHDGDVGMPRIQPLHRQPLGDQVFLMGNADHPGALLAQAHQHPRQLVQVMGAEGQVDKAVLLQNLLRHAGLLHHAAAYADQKPGLFLLQFLQPRHVAQRTAFGVVPDAAGVEQHQIGFGAVFGFGHAHFFQKSRQLFAVVGVHLTAVGHDEVAFRPFFHFPERADGFQLLLPLRFGHISGMMFQVCVRPFLTVHGHSTGARPVSPQARQDSVSISCRVSPVRLRVISRIPSRVNP